MEQPAVVYTGQPRFIGFCGVPLYRDDDSRQTRSYGSGAVSEKGGKSEVPQGARGKPQQYHKFPGHAAGPKLNSRLRGILLDLGFYTPSK